MAARRLIFVMLTLLVVSSVAAALVPVQRRAEESSSTSSSTAAPAPPRGELRHRTIDAQARKPATARIEIGDQLALRVVSARAGQVEIAALGELADVDPDAPARFDLLPTEPGRYPVRLLGAGRPIGRIEVVPRGPKRAKGAQAEASPVASASD